MQSSDKSLINLIAACLLGLCLLAASQRALAQNGPKLTFESKDALWVANLDGSEPKKIAEGQGPEISPDGTRLAFNTVQPQGQPAQRKIAVANLADGQIKVFEDLPSQNCMQPVWSPDGARLLFDYYLNNQRLIGVIKADGSDFRPVTQAGAKYKAYWSTAWAADGQSFFAQDMEFLYLMDLEAKILKKWKIEKLIPRGGMSGNIRMQASADGKFLLMDVEMAEKERKGWDGPPPALWLLDLGTEKASRLTPKDLYAWDCRWLDAQNILFASQGPGEKEPSLYRMSLNGQAKDKKLLVKNARTPSTSR